MPNWGIRRIVLALFARHVGAGLAIILWPTPVNREIRGNLADVLDRLHSFGVRASVDYSSVLSRMRVFS
jgi:hypothetical protein